MALTNQQRVGNALEHLGDGLAGFIGREFERRYRDQALTEDRAELLKPNTDKVMQPAPPTRSKKHPWLFFPLRSLAPHLDGTYRYCWNAENTRPISAGCPRSATASAMELWYLRRSSGVSFSGSSSSTPTTT